MMGTPKWLEIASPQHICINKTAIILSISKVHYDAIWAAMLSIFSCIEFSDSELDCSCCASWHPQYDHKNSQTFWYAFAHKGCKVLDKTTQLNGIQKHAMHDHLEIKYSNASDTETCKKEL
jgi:hypothetical protein